MNSAFFIRRCQPRLRRAGIILAAVLTSLVVVAILGGALTQSLVLALRQVRLNEQRQQSFWLAESAVQRALVNLRNSTDYHGETWHVAAESLGGDAAGVAIIRVEPANPPENGAWVRVEARYPDHPARRVVQQRELFVPVPSQGASP